MDFSKFSKKVQAVASTTAKKAGEQVQIAKLQIDKTTVNKDITDAYTALGKYCYLNMESEDLIEGIKEYKKDIDELKLKVAALEREIASVKTEGEEVTNLDVDFEEAAEEAAEAVEEAAEDIKD